MAIYTKRYEKFRGVDFSTDPALIDDSRSPYCQNLLSDNGGYPEKRLGWRTLRQYGECVYGIFRLVDKDGKPHLLIHHGTAMAHVPYVEFDPETGAAGHFDFAAATDFAGITMNEERSSAFTHDNKLYLLDGLHYLVFDGETLSQVVGFVPTTVIGAAPAGGGTQFESANYLTPWRKNSFKGDGTTKAFKLDGSIDAGTTVTASVDGSLTTGFTASGNTVTFTTAPPNRNGVDNVVITFSHSMETGNTANADPPLPANYPFPDVIKKCRFSAWFGAGENSRVFLSGNGDFKNWDFYSGLYDPTYFPVDGYTRIGSDASAIMGYLRQYDSLLIIKEQNDQDATMYVRTAELQTVTTLDIYGKEQERVVAVFPVHQGVSGIGAISPYTFGTLRDNPLFLSKEGVYTPVLSYGTDAQRSMQNRSFYVDSRLTQEQNLEDAAAVVWRGYYVLCLNGACYVADSRQATGKGANEARGYEWYYWTNIPAKVFLEADDELYFGTADGRVCKFRTDQPIGLQYSDDGVPIDAFWATKQDDDGDFMMQKTMDRLGSGVMVKPFSRSSVEISVRTEDLTRRVMNAREFDIFSLESLDFSRFTLSTNDSPDVMPFGLPVRKYRSLQIIARNREKDEGFGVYGFIKRYHPVKYVK